MNERRQQNIREYLQQSDVQERIRRDIEEARSKATVTISQAASLFDFSESKLREWERRGLLQTERPSREGKGSTGHRQYTPAELDKLAIIRELTSHGYAPGEIPLDVHKLWNQLTSGHVASLPGQFDYAIEIPGSRKEEQIPIDKRVEETEDQEFWRYFVSQVLRISLSLICENIPDTAVAGLVLPLEDRKVARTITAPSDLSQVGVSLVGWLGRNRSFYSFLDDAPTFEYPSDFRLETLDKQTSEDDIVLDNVLIVVQRRAKNLSLTSELLTTVRRLLALVYVHRDTWTPCFDYGKRDWLYQAQDVNGSAGSLDNTIYSNLVERIIELGGQTKDGQNRWHFCALLLPRETGLPIQQQVLAVRAQTSNSPYEVGMTTSNPAQADSLSLKAFQSGKIVYYAHTLPGESMTTYQLPPTHARGVLDRSAQPTLEQFTRSALAIPGIGEHGISSAVLYIAAKEAQAFTLDDQRVLRIIARMLEEQLLTSQARQQVLGKPGDLITNPAIVDTTFHGFGSETEFVEEIDELLKQVQQWGAKKSIPTGNLAIVSVDIDNQSRIATKYGNRVARNISQLVGKGIHRQLRNSDKYTGGKLFHISADKYYGVFRGITLEETRHFAKQVQEILQTTNYRITPTWMASERSTLPENMLEIAGVTVHLGISFYSFEKLGELLARSLQEIAVTNVRALIISGIEEILERGKFSGNCIYSWEPEIWGYKRLN